MSEDPQLPAHHVRLTKIPDNFNILVSGLPVVVVQHTWSEKTNKPSKLHYHIYWQHAKPVTRKTFAKGLKDMFSVHGQKDFMVSNPGDLASFWKYAMSSFGFSKKGASLVMWNITGEQLLPFPERPVIVDADLQGNLVTHTVATKKPKSKSWKVQFYEHCVDQYKSKPGDYTEITKGLVLRWFIEWSHYGFTDPQMFACVRYVYWEFASSQRQSEIIEEYSNNFISKI